jgi:hypothetical protein
MKFDGMIEAIDYWDIRIIIYDSDYYGRYDIFLLDRLLLDILFSLLPCLLSVIILIRP